MKKLTLTTEASPEWLAEVCHGEDCPCRGCWNCPFPLEEDICENVTPEMWAEILEDEDGE